MRSLPSYALPSTLRKQLAIVLATAFLSSCDRGTYVLVDVSADPAMATAAGGVTRLAATAVSESGQATSLDVVASSTAVSLPGSFSLHLPDAYAGPLSIVLEAHGADGSLLDRRATDVTVTAGHVAHGAVVLFSGGACPGVGPGYLCDDFEDASLEPGRWQTGSPASAVVDTTHAHTGQRAVHLTLPAVPAGGLVTAYADAAHVVFGDAPLGQYWVRAWVYLPSLPLDRVTILILARSSPTYEQDYVTAGSDGYALDGIGFGGASAVPPVAGRWTCLTWALDLESSAAGSLTLGGPDLPTLGPLAGPTQDSPALATFSLFAQVVNAQVAASAFDLWFDDVRVATQPLDCSAP